MLKAVLSKKDLTKTEYYEHVKDLLSDSHVQGLKAFSHHYHTTRFEHSLNVSYYNYLVCRFLRLDAKSAARAGLLHDLFFYDHREHTPVEGEGWHGVGHPKVAFFNASELFPLNEKEADMIINHMWPISPRLPRYREGFIITFVDKFCATAEALTRLCQTGVTRFKLAEAFALTLLIRITLR